MIHPLAAAIDLGGTNTALGLVDRKGKILARKNLDTTAFHTVIDFVEVIGQDLEDLYGPYRKNYTLSGIGVGAPNGNYYKGTIENAPNLPWKGIVPLADWLRKKTAQPVYLTNDANAAALGEKLFGAARDLNDFIFITLGTGLGSGFFCHGQLIHGHSGFAGELGHVIVMPHGRSCGCGRRGCLEQYCSGPGLIQTYLDIHKSEGRNTGLQPLSAKEIYEKALAGDETAFYAFQYTAELLGLALANAAAITNPEAIFLSGGLTEAGELLMNPLVISFENNLLNILQGKTSIEFSKLPVNDAALLGAASLVWEKN